MKRYTEIFWLTTHAKKDVYPWVDTAFAEPKHFYPLLRMERQGASYLQCPALSSTFKNSFVITAPFDLTITCNRATGTVSTDRYAQAFYDDFITVRPSANAKLPILISISICYLFFAHESVEIEVRDAPLITSESTKNIKLVPGRFNISKWLRPLEFAFEIIDDTKPVTIKTGDPLFMVTFTTPNNKPVKLTRKIETPEISAAFVAFTRLKEIRPNLKLSECYDLASNFINAIKRWLIK